MRLVTAMVLGGLFAPQLSCTRGRTDESAGVGKNSLRGVTGGYPAGIEPSWNRAAVANVTGATGGSSCYGALIHSQTVSPAFNNNAWCGAVLTSSGCGGSGLEVSLQNTAGGVSQFSGAKIMGVTSVAQGNLSVITLRSDSNPQLGVPFEIADGVPEKDQPLRIVGRNPATPGAIFPGLHSARMRFKGNAFNSKHGKYPLMELEMYPMDTEGLGCPQTVDEGTPAFRESSGLHGIWTNDFKNNCECTDAKKDTEYRLIHEAVVAAAKEYREKHPTSLGPGNVTLPAVGAWLRSLHTQVVSPGYGMCGDVAERLEPMILERLKETQYDFSCYRLATVTLFGYGFFLNPDPKALNVNHTFLGIVSHDKDVHYVHQNKKFYPELETRGGAILKGDATTDDIIYALDPWMDGPDIPYKAPGFTKEGITERDPSRFHLYYASAMPGGCENPDVLKAAYEVGKSARGWPKPHWKTLYREKPAYTSDCFLRTGSDKWRQKSRARYVNVSSSKAQIEAALAANAACNPGPTPTPIPLPTATPGGCHGFESCVVDFDDDYAGNCCRPFMISWDQYPQQQILDCCKFAEHLMPDGTPYAESNRACSEYVTVQRCSERFPEEVTPIPTPIQSPSPIPP